MNLRRKRLRLMRDTQWRGYARTATGNPILLSQVRSMANLSVLGNSAQSGTPSPDNPVEVVGSGERTGNLFDISQITSKNGGYVDNNKIYIKNYSFTSGISPQKFLEMTGLQIGDTFTCRAQYTQMQDYSSGARYVNFIPKRSGLIGLTLFDYSSSSDKNNGFRVSTIPSDFNNDNYYGLYFYGGNISTPVESEIRATWNNFAIYKGAYDTETLPPYEPYGYKVAVQASGRNLFNINSIISNNNITNNGNEIVINAKRVYSDLKPSEFMEMTGLKPGDKFTSRCKTNVTAGTDGSACRIIFINNSSGAAVYIFYGYSVKTISIPADFSDNGYSTLVFDGVENGDSTFANLMVFKGAYTADTLPPYESYKPPQTFNVYMSKPLHGVGDAHDTVLLNFDNKTAKLYQKTNIKQYTSAVKNREICGDCCLYYLDADTDKKQMIQCKCNLFESTYAMTEDINSVFLSQYDAHPTLLISIEKNIIGYDDTTDDINSGRIKLNNWLLQKQMEGTPLTVTYALADDYITTTDITALQQWDALPNLKGTWILTAIGETEPTLTAEYYSNERSTE